MYIYRLIINYLCHVGCLQIDKNNPNFFSSFNAMHFISLLFQVKDYLGISQMVIL